MIDSVVYPKVQEEHVNKWVVFSNDTREVLSVGDTLRGALEQILPGRDTGVLLVPEPLPYA